MIEGDCDFCRFDGLGVGRRSMCYDCEQEGGRMRYWKPKVEEIV